MRLENRQGGATRKAPRSAPDFFETPREATEALLRHEHFEGAIWEPACGKGAISEVLEEHGYEVFSSDLNNYGYGDLGVDFLGISQHEGPFCPNIVTNPPYNLVNEFILRGLDLAERKLALLLRVGHLEGQRRYREIYSQHPPARIYVFPQRLKFWNGRKDQQDAFKYPHCWMVWDTAHRGRTELRWMEP